MKNFNFKNNFLLSFQIVIYRGDLCKETESAKSGERN